MTIFKTFFRLLQRDMGSLMIYLGIFAGMGIAIASSNASTMEKTFSEEKISIAVADLDQSPLSRAVVEYLGKTGDVTEIGASQEMVQVPSSDAGAADKAVHNAAASSSDWTVSPLPDSTLRKLNDDVRFDLYAYCLILPKGFGQDPDTFTPRYISSASSAAASLATQRVETFLRDAAAYRNAGLSEAAALKKASQAASRKPSVTLLSGRSENGFSFSYYLFNFASYGFFMIICQMMGIVLPKLRTKEIARRIAVSSYGFLRRNREIILAVLLSALLLLVPFLAVCAIAGRGQSGFDHYGSYAMNLFSLVPSAIGLGFFISAVSENGSVISMMTNSIVLAMCFLSGVFVPRAYMNPAVLSAAHFTPLYWFVEGNEIINGFSSGPFPWSSLASCMLMQLLFCALLLSAGMILSRLREQK